MKDSLLPREWILSRRALNLIFLSNGFSFATIVPHFPWLQRKLELGDAMTGFALLFPAIGAVSMMLLTGNLIQRFGSRKLILVGGLVMQLCLPLILLMPTLIFLAPVLLLIGGASGMMDISMNAQAARIEHVYDKPIMSSFHAVWSLGTLLGGGLASLLLGLAWTPLEHAGMIACMLFILVIVCGRWLITEEEPSPEKAPLISIPRGPVLVLGLLAFVAMIAEGAATDWSSIFARNELEATPSQAAAVFTVFALTMTLGRFLGDRLVHHWGPDRVLRYACWVGAAGFMAGLLSENLDGVMFGFACLGLGLANTVPILFSGASRIPGVNPGVGIAGVATLGYFGFLIGPPLIGTIAEFFGLDHALLLIVLFCTLIALNAGRISQGRDSKPENPETVQGS
ncbi:MAG: MFS transporter [SAR324 cluster bacterium]|mgnify:FL=1|nr:MFS transporter [Deltaproteobacteria bacterium]MDP6090668.1 MFS transporter [SAR324 cluster bacterium]MDP6330056.1 MFS transporter [SAR324 cluster bacterium]MDP7139806.1 MFS transporter [SAR324 cluster bacterium]MDP7501820.1 MFS transporter [SAR324 cluster bacterium]